MRCCQEFDISFELGQKIQHHTECPMAVRDKRDENFCVWTLAETPLSQGEFCDLYGGTCGIAEVHNPYVAADIEDRGGFVFDTKEGAEAACQFENFPPGFEHEFGDPKGTFCHERIIEMVLYDRSKRGRKVYCSVYVRESMS